MHMPVAVLGLQEALGLLRQCLEQGKVRPGRHFRQELMNESLEFADAWHVMGKTGNIFDPPEHDIKTGEWKYTIEDHETDGKWLAIVFSFKSLDQAFLITAWTVAAREKK